MRRLLLLAVLALLIAGCGSASEDSAKDFKGAQRSVATVVEDLEDAARDDKPQRICDDLLARSLLARQRQAGTNCRTAVSQGLDDVDQFDIEVDSVRIAGARATARVTSGSGNDEKHETLRLEREGQTWRIASLGTG